MTHSRHKFNEIANPETEKPKYPPPFSLRLTYEERARLDAERGDKSLAAHIRERLFGDDAACCSSSDGRVGTAFEGENCYIALSGGSPGFACEPQSYLV